MIAIGIIALFLIIYVFIIRPWHLTWGATTKEVAFALPGDEMVKKPDFNATRGISISAPADEVWKWTIHTICARPEEWYVG